MWILQEATSEWGFQDGSFKRQGEMKKIQLSARQYS
jgi:hypothetical protein